MFRSGEKCFLRALELGDANSDYLSWVNNPETTRGLVTGRFPSNLEQLKAYLQDATAKSAVFLAICDIESKKHIGNIKLDQFDWISRTAELGILIGDRNFWGKGIATEACRLLLDYAKKDLNLNKVTLSVFSNNPAAKRVYEKLGFVEEGCLRQHLFIDGKYEDKFYMSVFLNE